VDKFVAPDGVSVVIAVEAKGAEEFAEKLATSLTAISKLQKVLHRWSNKLRAAAVANASGKTVSYKGSSFTINRQTGFLTKSIQVSQTGPLADEVRATAAYAAAVEEGHKSFDMKPFLPKDKPIPIRVAAGTKGAKEISLTGSTGTTTGKTWVLFRYVSPNSKGWIMPAKAARPFMAAAAAEIEPGFTKEVADTFAAHFGPIVE